MSNQHGHHHYDFRKVDGIWQRRQTGRDSNGNLFPWRTLRVEERTVVVKRRKGRFAHGESKGMVRENDVGIIERVWSWH